MYDEFPNEGEHLAYRAAFWEMEAHEQPEELQHITEIYDGTCTNEIVTPYGPYFIRG